MSGAAGCARQTGTAAMSAAAAGERPRDRVGVGSRTVRILAFSDPHRDEWAGRSLIERSPQVDVVARGRRLTSRGHGRRRGLASISVRAETRKGSNVGGRADAAERTSAPSSNAAEAHARRGVELAANDRNPAAPADSRPLGLVPSPRARHPIRRSEVLRSGTAAHGRASDEPTLGRAEADRGHSGRDSRVAATCAIQPPVAGRGLGAAVGLARRARGTSQAELEGLQDAVYRQAVLEQEKIGDLRRRTEPDQLARDLGQDARRRGL